MLLGQMATTDPTRAPAGAESLWAYTHIPHGALRGEVSDPDVEAMADRMEARIEEHAPGFRDRVLNRRILGPDELESRNANLVGGSLNGGTAKPQQELIFRPVPGLGRAETPVRGLFLASAAAHPGGGVHGACGSNAARAALAHDRIRLRRS
jgi:phytoene dehydrogenase-like protein